MSLSSARLIFSFALACSLVLPIQTFAASFSDVPESAWFGPYIELAADKGIVSGYANSKGVATGRFGPADHVTIAEALKIAIEGSGHKISKTMGGAYWVLPYLDYAFEHHFAITAGKSNVDFQKNATRAEVAALVADAFAANEDGGQSSYDDVTSSTAYAKAIEALSRDGIVSGDTDENGKSLGHFRPGDLVNRAEAVKIMIEARHVYMHEDLPTISSMSSSSETSSSEEQSSVPVF